MMKLAVFGNPVSHSKSPQIHSWFAESVGADVQYTAIEAPVDGFANAIKQFEHDGGVGANVTVPFKQDAFRLCEHKSERAQKAGAVNTLILKDGEWQGDNTDGVGIMRDIVNNQGWQVKGKRVVILGAGGAVRGIMQPLIEHGPTSVVIANRTASKAFDLATMFQAGPVASTVHNIIESDSDDTVVIGGGYEMLDGVTADIVINATSSGLHGEMPKLPNSFDIKEAQGYDMVYGNTETVFCQWAKQKGAVGTADGLGMLVEQAAESFSLWTGKTPATRDVIERLRN